MWRLFNYIFYIGSDEDKLEMVKSDLNKYKRTMKGGKLFFQAGSSVSSGIRTTITNLVKEVFDKIKQDHETEKQEQGEGPGKQHT